MARRLKASPEETGPGGRALTREERTAAMRKAAAGAVIGMFTVGAGGMTLLGSVLGTHAEAVSLALMGVGLFAGSAMLGSGGKETVASAGMAKEA